MQEADGVYKRWSEFVSKVAQAFDDRLDVYAVSKTVYKSMPASVREYAVVAALVENAREMNRKRVGEKEYQSQMQVAREEFESRDPDFPMVKSNGEPLRDSRGEVRRGLPHGGSTVRDIKSGSAVRGCECKPCVKAREHLEMLRKIDEDAARRLQESLTSLVIEYTHNLKMKWTKDLLGEKFSLRDGTLVSWGSATVEQHAERVAIFMANASKNVEGAARHRLAIEDITKKKATCLNEVVGKKAA